MSILDKVIEAAWLYSDGRLHYWNGSSGVGCSDFMRMILRRGTVITQEEADDVTSLWAINNYHKVLDDTTRFKKHSASETPQDGWIEWYAYHHVAMYYKGGQFEAAPESSHYLSDNGKTGVGYYSKHHNCSGGTLTCYYEIIEGDSKMKNTELVNKLADIVDNYPTHYRGTDGNESACYNIGQFDGKAFCFDCSGFIKSGGFWGWNGSKTSAYGGATYAQTCPDINDAGFYNACEMHPIGSVSDIPVGALLWKQGHVGVYEGNGYGLECTPIGNNGCQRIAVSGRGWTHYGIMPWVEYDGTSGHSVLQKGSTGAEVKELQTLLNKHGASLDVDGSFGNLTKQAVIDYQTAKGLVVDGIVGNQTWTSLETETTTVKLTKLDALTAVQEAESVIKGIYGNNPGRENTLTSKYGSDGYRKIQDIVTIACR